MPSSRSSRKSSVGSTSSRSSDTHPIQAPPARQYHPHTHTHPRNHLHQIQFYTTESSLFTAISSHILPSFFSSQHAAIIVATKPHLDALDLYFRSQNLAPDALRQREQLFIAPAEAILEHLTPGGQVSAQRFNDYFTPLFTRLQAKYPKLLVYGELVNILCERAEHKQAAELETVWEAFLRGRDASLLCGYNMNAFVDDGLEKVFERLCESHAVVTPAEDMMSGVGMAAGRKGKERGWEMCLAMLQQRTLRLEMERKKREEAEGRLKAVMEHLGERGISLPISVSPAQDQTTSTHSSSRSPSPAPKFTPQQHRGIGIITATHSINSPTTLHTNPRFHSLTSLPSIKSTQQWLATIHPADRDQVSTSLRITDHSTRRISYRFWDETTGHEKWVSGETTATEEGYVHSVIELSGPLPPRPVSPPLSSTQITTTTAIAGEGATLAISTTTTTTTTTTASSPQMRKRHHNEEPPTPSSSGSMHPPPSPASSSDERRKRRRTVNADSFSLPSSPRQGIQRSLPPPSLPQHQQQKQDQYRPLSPRHQQPGSGSGSESESPRVQGLSQSPEASPRLHQQVPNQNGYHYRQLPQHQQQHYPQNAAQNDTSSPPPQFAQMVYQQYQQPIHQEHGQYSQQEFQHQPSQHPQYSPPHPPHPPPQYHHHNLHHHQQQLQYPPPYSQQNPAAGSR